MNSKKWAGWVLTVVILAACSGDSTGPKAPQIPQIGGVYTVSESLPAVACTPVQPPPGGTVILTAFSQNYRGQIDQSGPTFKFYEVGFPNDFETGTVDSNGIVAIRNVFSFQEDPREGNRIFFVELTIVRDLKLQSNGNITGTTTVTNVFHEGALTAPVFTTCTRQGGSTTMIRTGG